jgi:hypothetical protein
MKRLISAMEIGGLVSLLLHTLSLYRKGFPCTPSAWVGRCRGQMV